MNTVKCGTAEQCSGCPILILNDDRQKPATGVVNAIMPNYASEETLTDCTAKRQEVETKIHGYLDESGIYLSSLEVAVTATTILRIRAGRCSTI